MPLFIRVAASVWLSLLVEFGITMGAVDIVEMAVILLLGPISQMSPARKLLVVIALLASIHR